MNAKSKAQVSIELANAVVSDIAVTMEDGCLPAHADFRGYVVYVFETDDYLAHFEDAPGLIRRACTDSPEHAFLYPTWKAANDVARRLPKLAAVGILFDLGSQLCVSFGGLDIQ